MELPVRYYDYGFTELLCATQSKNEVSDFVLVVLNQPITNTTQFLSVWNRAYLRIVVDGAADEVAPVLTSNSGSSLVDVLIGDLDSATPASLSYFQQSGAHIIRIDDCDTTDFQKALTLLTLNSGDLISLFNCKRANKPITTTESTSYQTIYSSSPPSSLSISACDAVATHPSPIVCLCYNAFGGRLDQVMGNINSLYLFRTGAFRPILYGDGNVCELLDGVAVLNVKALRNLISCSANKSYTYCGYYPLLGETNVATRGLQWDLGNVPEQQYELAATLATAPHARSEKLMVPHGSATSDFPAKVEADDTAQPRSVIIDQSHLCRVQFSGLLSTNNHIVADFVTIVTERPLVWSTHFEYSVKSQE